MPDEEKQQYRSSAAVPQPRAVDLEARARYDAEIERAEFHSGPRADYDTVILSKTSPLFSRDTTYELRDGRGHVATVSTNGSTSQTKITLQCTDGSELSGNVARDAVLAVTKSGPTTKGWFRDEYQFKVVNPIRQACTVDHNNRIHGGRYPE